MSETATRKVGGTIAYSAPDPTWIDAGDGFERAIVFEPGFKDPTSGPRSYGSHGMEMRFMLRGPNGVTQFVMSTGWVPGVKGVSPALADYYPTGSDLGRHAHVPQYEGEDEGMGAGDCAYLGGKCWYDGSGLQADPVVVAFIREGEPAVWRALREYHDRLVAP